MEKSIVFNIHQHYTNRKRTFFNIVVDNTVDNDKNSLKNQRYKPFFGFKNFLRFSTIKLKTNFLQKTTNL